MLFVRDAFLNRLCIDLPVTRQGRQSSGLSSAITRCSGSGRWSCSTVGIAMAIVVYFVVLAELEYSQIMADGTTKVRIGSKRPHQNVRPHTTSESILSDWDNTNCHNSTVNDAGEDRSIMTGAIEALYIYDEHKYVNTFLVTLN